MSSSEINDDILADAFSSLFQEEKNQETDTDKESKETGDIDKHVKVAQNIEKHITRRIKSELALEKELPWHFEPGTTYHCVSFGDVDSLTYLRTIVKQQKVKYVLLSTWCMALADAIEIKKWLDSGYIERVDFYVGEIFQRSYADVFNFIQENCLKNGGRVCIFRNHSKVIAGYGDRFDFAIASSANINTKPRCENTTITIDTKVAEFYKDFFDGIIAFNKGFEDWQPYKLQERTE